MDEPNEPVEQNERKLIVIFVEGRFDRVVEAATPEDAVVYCQGYCAAAEKFHANTALYMLPEDADEMNREEHRDEVRKALEEAIA